MCNSIQYKDKSKLNEFYFYFSTRARGPRCSSLSPLRLMGHPYSMMDPPYDLVKNYFTNEEFGEKTQY